MSPADPPPAWKLPEGVDASLWEYAHTPRLAQDEDTYFQSAPLFVADAEALSRRFTVPGPLIDLGCGAGRHAIQFARRGFPVAAVDLAQPMLAVVDEKAQRLGLPIQGVRANLCRLGCFPDQSFQYALSMFSTLGMIRGASARRHALAEAFRILRPGGQMALHAHNLWLNLRDPQGRRWLVPQLAKIWQRDPEAGDRRMTYRGIPGMVVHLFRWGELRSLITSVGFDLEEVLAIDEIHAQPIPWPWLGHPLRAGGWILFLRKPG
jgi:ubiquinone/menaquinone biosynthesis C-methylase UbiE